jgi:hypothetical protein
MLSSGSAVPFAGQLAVLTQKVSALEAELTKREPDLELYDGDYFRSIDPSRARRVSDDEILKRALDHQFILIGDEHGSLEPIIRAQAIIGHLVQLKQMPVLAVEFIFSRHQRFLDAFLTALEDVQSLELLRRQIRFDEKGWGWKWEHVSRLLRAAKHLTLRVIAAEQGFGFMGDLKRRDRFTAKLITEDVRKHPGEIYVILYGTMHILGRKHLSGLLLSRGFKSQLKIISHLGRLTQAVAEAANSTGAGVLDLGDGIIYTSAQDMITNLQAYHSQLTDLLGSGNSPGDRCEQRA